MPNIPIASRSIMLDLLVVSTQIPKFSRDLMQIYPGTPRWPMPSLLAISREWEGPQAHRIDVDGRPNRSSPTDEECRIGPSSLPQRIRNGFMGSLQTGGLATPTRPFGGFMGFV